MKDYISPCLWFNGQAEEAAHFYTTHLQPAKVEATSPMVTEINLSGQKLVLLNGGPAFRPNPSISLFYLCETEEEITRIWDAFAKEGQVLMPLDTYSWSDRYGWISDRYGVSWQFSLGRIEGDGQRIMPFLLFCGDQYGKAEDAIHTYAKIFGDAELAGILRYGDNEEPDTPGKVKHAQFSLKGHSMMVMESAHPHQFGFNEAVSLMVLCDTQKEIDHYWEKLAQGGEESRCGWVKDKFGVWWQVVPRVLGRLMSDPDRARKTAEAFKLMGKFDIATLEQASGA